MKLYYTPGACSLSPHIVLSELGMKYEVEKVDLKTKKTETGADYNNIAEKGAVPILVLDNGEQLTEGVAIIQYLADQKPEAGLSPKSGTMERARLQEMLNYISTELHKNFGPLFSADQIGEKGCEFFVNKLKKNYAYINKKLEGKQYLLGDKFSLADAYLFTVTNWLGHIKLDVAQWPNVAEYQKRVAARPGVQAAMQAEGLLDKKAA